MVDLGTGPVASTLEAVQLSLDEMQWLQEKLDIDELPVVLQAVARYDNADDRYVALARAAEALVQRGLVESDQVDHELAERLRTLYRPHWVVALRLFVDDTVSRLCLAKGDDDRMVLALRGPESYVIDAVHGDPAGPIIAALGAAKPLELSGANVPTAHLGEVFDDAGDPRTTAKRLEKIGANAADAAAIANAMVHCYAHCEIVGVIYGDAVRDQADSHIALFDTRDGRFVMTASKAGDGTKWSALSTGTDARLRKALQDLIKVLPDRQDFPHPGVGQ